MNNINKTIMFLIVAFVPFIGLAQQTDEPQMADTFRSEGKIYVVITVISIVFICLIGYLIYLDIKLKKLENKK